MIMMSAEKNKTKSLILEICNLAVSYQDESIQMTNFDQSAVNLLDHLTDPKIDDQIIHDLHVYLEGVKTAMEKMKSK